MPFEGAEGGDQNARRGLLAYALATPAPFQRPFFQRPFPSKHMPQTRTASRVQATDNKDCPPHRLARFFDAQTGFVPRSQTGPVINPRARYIIRAQRVQLRGREAGAEILSGLPHPGG